MFHSFLMPGLHSRTARDKTRTRVRSVHLSHLTCSRPVLFSSRSYRKNVSESYASQRTRMSRLIIESTVVYTLIRFSNIIYLALRKTVNFFSRFEGLTFTAGYASTHKPKKVSFSLAFYRASFYAGNFFIYLVSGRLSYDFPRQLCLVTSHESANVYICAYFGSFTTRQKSRQVPLTKM